MRHRLFLGAVLATALASSAAAQDWPNLPTTFQPANNYTDGFETYAGVVPPHMATNALDSLTGLPDPEAWCNIGQQGLPLSAATGTFCLEMGLDPASNNYHDVRNGLVIGLDGTGAGADLWLRAKAINHGEETDTWDGVWVSTDGLNWTQAFGGWSNLRLSTGVWGDTPPIGLSTTGTSTAGQFYLLFAQDDNFPYGYLDGIGIDDISIDTNAPPPPFANLPTTFQPAGSFFEDFESLGGVVPSYFGVNATNAATNLPDPEAYCNAGQTPAIYSAASGMYCLEMAFDPISNNNHYVRNGLVIGLDGTGVTSDLWLDFQFLEYYETSDQWDGVFLSDDGVNWVLVQQLWNGSTTWAPQAKVNLSNLGVNVSGQFYLLFAEEGNQGYAYSDGIGIDDIAVNTTPPPPAWPNLPTSFQAAAGYHDDFESYLGVVPSHFGVNELDSLTGLPDPEAWCNIGQHALAITTTSGVYCLEMGLIPGSTNYHNVRNGLVIGLNGAGATELNLDFQAIDHGEETNTWDGVWVSDDGLNWYQSYGPWTALLSSWQPVTAGDLMTAGANTNGDFYLLFAQEDNFPYGYLDGIGIDDVNIVDPGPPGPTLSVTGLVAGGLATVQVDFATPGGLVRHGYSLVGGGPTTTPYGDLLLSPPYSELPAMTANASGTARMTMPIPPGTTGVAVWLHAFDVGSLTFTNGIATFVG
ncbi:MAG: hypothetical protein D6702_12550 [Planctomycetota bacterium]|nr:MAG: hypothetical protein D6702_12550 [Planctomycetota bacterium]